VVDNDSPDESATIARSVPGVQVVVQANLGFGAGCNTGAQALAGAELLLFLNPDAIIETAELLGLVSYLDTHPDCALASPLLYSGNTALTSGGRRATVATELRPIVPTVLAKRFPDRRLPASRSRTGPMGYVEGACFLARSRSLHDIGGFDEAFFLFFEEMDVARRLEAAGKTVDLVTESRAQHQVAVSRRALSDGGRTHLLRSTVLYLYGEGPWKAATYVAVARACLWLRARRGLKAATARSWSRTLASALADARSGVVRL
jgi:GT2 family glycosyltransferase